MSTNSNFLLNAALTVRGGDENLSPVGLDPQERQVNLNIINYSGNATQWTNQRTWLVVHGWNAALEDFTEIARNISTANPDDTVLTLDWSQASGHRPDVVARQSAPPIASAP